MKHSFSFLFSLTLLCFLALPNLDAFAQAPATNVDSGKAGLLKAEEEYAKLLKDLEEAGKKVIVQTEAVQKAATADKPKAETELATLVKSHTDVTSQVVAAAAKVATLRAGNGVAVDSDAIYKASLGALTTLFVVAVMLETAMALLLNWVGFLAYFSRRAVRPLVMLVASAVVVFVFKLDIVASLISIYKGTPAEAAGSSGIPSMLLTAMILAGGSAGVRGMMSALGFRLDQPSDQPPPLSSKEAWLSVVVTNIPRGGKKIHVRIKPLGDAPADMKPIAGTLGAEHPRLKHLLCRNRDRFPSNGGHVLEANKLYEISVTEDDAASGESRKIMPPTNHVFAPRAIVDLEVSYTRPET